MSPFRIEGEHVPLEGWSSDGCGCAHRCPELSALTTEVAVLRAPPWVQTLSLRWNLQLCSGRSWSLSRDLCYCLGLSSQPLCRSPEARFERAPNQAPLYVSSFGLGSWYHGELGPDVLAPLSRTQAPRLPGPDLRILQHSTPRA